MAEHRVYELLTGLRAAVRVVGESGDKSEKASPKSGWRQKFLVSGAPQVIIYARRLDGRFTTTFMSDNVEALLGHEPRNFVDDPSFWSDCIHPDDAPGVMEKLAMVAHNGHHVHEYRFKHKDGHYRWMRDELNLLRDGAGNPYEILGSWIDVTERKRGEDALRLSEARYRSLIDSAPMGMISFDSSGDITEFNPAVLSILGLPIFERSSRMDLFTLLPMVEAGISEAIFRCMESGESGIGEFQYKSRGRPVFVRVHVVPIRDEDGSITGAHAFLLDLSDQKRAEELIEWLDMSDFADLRCGSLSTGQKQRTSIGRALVANPPVLIMDEPTLGLDVLSNRMILDFIRRERQAGKTIVLSTHYLDEAEQMCDRIGLLHNGRLVAEGTIEELRERTGEDRLSAIFLQLIRQPRAVGTSVP